MLNAIIDNTMNYLISSSELNYYVYIHLYVCMCVYLCTHKSDINDNNNINK